MKVAPFAMNRIERLPYNKGNRSKRSMFIGRTVRKFRMVNGTSKRSKRSKEMQEEALKKGGSKTVIRNYLISGLINRFFKL